MKTCPFCAEQIQSAAKKCRYCAELLPANSAQPASPNREVTVIRSNQLRDHVVSWWSDGTANELLRTIETAAQAAGLAVRDRVPGKSVVLCHPLTIKPDAALIDVQATDLDGGSQARFTGPSHPRSVTSGPLKPFAAMAAIADHLGPDISYVRLFEGLDDKHWDPPRTKGTLGHAAEQAAPPEGPAPSGTESAEAAPSPHPNKASDRAHARPAQPPRIRSLDVGCFSRADWLIMAGGAAVFVGGFLDWITVSGAPGYGVSGGTAFDFPLTGTIPWLLLIACAAITVPLAQGWIPNHRNEWTTFVFGAATLAGVLLAIRLFLNPIEGGELNESVEFTFDNVIAIGKERLQVEGLRVGAGPGLLMSAVGGMVALLGASTNFRQQRPGPGFRS